MDIVFDTPETVSNVITNKTLTIEEKINTLVNGSGKLVKFLKAFEQYRTKMSDNSIEPEDGAYQNFNLYTKINKIAEQKVYEEFKAMFDIVNLYFLHYKDGAFSEFKLHRFDYAWTWGDKQLNTYNMFATLIPMLCDWSTRASNLKRISLAKAFNLKKVVLKEQAIMNMRKYYTA